MKITKAVLAISGQVDELILSERQSLHAFTYLTLIIMAYYGPNAEILGNIKLRIWQFQNPITDIYIYVYNVGLWLSVDVLSLIVNGILLWHFCNINVMNNLKKLQTTYWLIFAIAEAYIFMEVSSWFLYLVCWIILKSFSTAFLDVDHQCRPWPNIRLWLEKWKLYSELSSII